ncbi:MAG: hypothetical protein KDB90_14925 [Planctomycetes bacterium]|nr:hypothetical protein [Planctomycetota bacterium]
MQFRALFVAGLIVAACMFSSAQSRKNPVTGEHKRKNPRLEELSIGLANSPISKRIWDVRATSDHEQRVDAALKWLADHQARDGSWSAFDFNADSKRYGVERRGNIEFRNAGKPGADIGWDDKSGTLAVGMTGLAVMAFTAAGYSHREGPYATELALAVDYLLGQQVA